jgi:tRNA (cytidine32/uridine32-2'-O)-methyltransferase
MLDNIKIVLVETTHPGNIGAVARAMKTMNLSNLCLVNPKIFPHVSATARAAGADDLLANAKITATLEDALANCRLVFGTSARARSLPTPLLMPREAANKIIAETDKGEIAVVFGRENNGLSNEELQLCHYHVNIPSNVDFSSLNVAASVQLIAYEIKMASGVYEKEQRESETIENCDEVANVASMEMFYKHLEEVLIELGFLRIDKSVYLMRRLRRLYNRARLEKLELNILRGILTAIQKKYLK